MPAQSAPQSAPAIVAKSTWSSGFIPSNEEPIQTASTAPAMYWPVPPMLKRPQRKANATARPVRISVVVAIRVCCMLSAAEAALVAGHPGEEPVEARPVEDGPVGRQRVLPRRDEDDEAADEECEHGGEHGRDQRRRPSARRRSGRGRDCLTSGDAGGVGTGRPGRADRSCSLTPPPPARGRRRSSRRRAPPPSRPAGTRRRSRPRT